MDLKSFVDKAKEAAAAVTEQAKSAMASPASEAPAPDSLEVAAPAEDGEQALLIVTTQETVVARGAPGKSFSALASETINQVSAAGAEKIQELVASFQQALPAIKTAGYELTEFEIELGITPKLIPHFRHAARSAEDVDGARGTLRDNKLGSLILGALLKAGDVHKQISVAGFAFSHIEIELGLIPSVRLQYKQEGPSQS
ncbi:MAG: hypothetical protein ACT4OF_09110 [Caulobacteraceae bacterium]